MAHSMQLPAVRQVAQPKPHWAQWPATVTPKSWKWKTKWRKTGAPSVVFRKAIVKPQDSLGAKWPENYIIPKKKSWDKETKMVFQVLPKICGKKTHRSLPVIPFWVDRSPPFGSRKTPWKLNTATSAPFLKRTDGSESWNSPKVWDFVLASCEKTSGGVTRTTIKKKILWLVVEPTHLKNMLVKLEINLPQIIFGVIIKTKLRCHQLVLLTLRRKKKRPKTWPLTPPEPHHFLADYKSKNHLYSPPALPSLPHSSPTGRCGTRINSNKIGNEKTKIFQQMVDNPLVCWNAEIYCTYIDLLGPLLLKVCETKEIPVRIYRKKVEKNKIRWRKGKVQGICFSFPLFRLQHRALYKSKNVTSI